MCVCVSVGISVTAKKSGFKLPGLFFRVYLQDGNGKVCRVIRIGTRKSQVEYGTQPTASECVTCTAPLVEMCSEKLKENCRIP